MPTPRREVLEVEFAFERSARLAKEVTQYGRKCERLAVVIPGEFVAYAATKSTTELLVAFEQDDLMTQLRESEGGGDATEPTTNDDDASHGRRLSGEQQGGAAGERAERDETEQPDPGARRQERQTPQLVGV